MYSYKYICSYIYVLTGPSKYLKSAWSGLAFINVCLMCGVGYFYVINQVESLKIQCATKLTIQSKHGMTVQLTFVNNC